MDYRLSGRLDSVVHSILPSLLQKTVGTLVEDIEEKEYTTSTGKNSCPVPIARNKSPTFTFFYTTARDRGVFSTVRI